MIVPYPSVSSVNHQNIDSSRDHPHAIVLYPSETLLPKSIFKQPLNRQNLTSIILTSVQLDSHVFVCGVAPMVLSM